MNPKFDWTLFFARFVSGFLVVGLIAGLSFPLSFWAAFAIGGGLGGLAAWKYGDPFWSWLSRWLR